MTAEEIISVLGLQPHPEGGCYRETYRHEADDGGRGCCTAIYYLLRVGERSHWHRVDADELWHWYSGAPLYLSLSREGRAAETRLLGPQVAEGQVPQVLVPAGVWQSAWSQGDWSLVGCTVSPAFEFDGFELAPEDWKPGKGPPQV